MSLLHIRTCYNYISATEISNNCNAINFYIITQAVGAHIRVYEEVHIYIIMIVYEEGDICTDNVHYPFAIFEVCW